MKWLQAFAKCLIYLKIHWFENKCFLHYFYTAGTIWSHWIEWLRLVTQTRLLKKSSYILLSSLISCLHPSRCLTLLAFHLSDLCRSEERSAPQRTPNSNPTGWWLPVGFAVSFLDTYRDGHIMAYQLIWLVVWNIFLFFHILGIVTPTDFHIFQRGRYTTNQ